MLLGLESVGLMVVLVHYDSFFVRDGNGNRYIARLSKVSTVTVREANKSAREIAAVIISACLYRQYSKSLLYLKPGGM